MAYDTMYDKAGNLISNEDFPALPEYFGKNTYLGVDLQYVPQIGYTFQYQGKDYEIRSVTIYRENSGVMAIVLTCLQIDEDGNDAGQDPIILKLMDNSDIYGIVGY